MTKPEQSFDVPGRLCVDCVLPTGRPCWTVKVEFGRWLQEKVRSWGVQGWN